MGSRAVSPGGALLRTSRMFSLPKPLPKPQDNNLGLGESKSDTMTQQHPLYQAITSPRPSRERGDWGIKRPFPLRSTMATTTPALRVKHVDSIESITDIDSAADHTLSLEKFQEMRIALTTPRVKDRRTMATASRPEAPPKSVFEEDMDVTDLRHGNKDHRRWKFEGPWLANMTEGQFSEYVNDSVRPKRSEFRQMLREKLAEETTSAQTNEAMEKGRDVPPPVKAADISEDEFTDYLRSLRNDRVTLYALVSKFLDLAPLGQPVGIIQSFWPGRENATENPWAKSGPPPSHPSAGISYLRTTSFMENHPVYGPQAKRTPVQARVLYPRAGNVPAKLGVGGFVANAPAGDNEFNVRHGRFNSGHRSVLKGITHLDTTTFGGAKAYVEAQSASVDPHGKVVVQLGETHNEAQLNVKEAKGQATVYEDTPAEDTSSAASGGNVSQAQLGEQRIGRIWREISSDPARSASQQKDVVGNSSSYGLEKPIDTRD